VPKNVAASLAWRIRDQEDWYLLVKIASHRKGATMKVDVVSLCSICVVVVASVLQFCAVLVVLVAVLVVLGVQQAVGVAS
jgi:hypothetical protein